MLMKNNDGDGDDPLNFFEAISYEKLIKTISALHPVDPDTKKSFSFKDRVTVKDYNSKISDTCFCYQAQQQMI